MRLMSTAALALLALLACSRPMAEATIDPSPPADTTAIVLPQVPTITVAAKKGRTYANIRLSADSRSPVIARVPVGTVLKTYGRDGEWHQVQVPATGALGWIRTVYIE